MKAHKRFFLGGELMHIFIPFGGNQQLLLFSGFDCEGELKSQGFYNGDMLHGEYISWSSDGEVDTHQYYVNDELIHDFKKYPKHKDVEQSLFGLYGAPLFNLSTGGIS